MIFGQTFRRASSCDASKREHPALSPRISSAAAGERGQLPHRGRARRRRPVRSSHLPPDTAANRKSPQRSRASRRYTYHFTGPVFVSGLSLGRRVEPASVVQAGKTWSGERKDRGPTEGRPKQRRRRL
ncbi:hypothetical protein AGIG_G18529 [Arapaima gigas]